MAFGSWLLVGWKGGSKGPDPRSNLQTKLDSNKVAEKGVDTIPS